MCNNIEKHKDMATIGPLRNTVRTKNKSAVDRIAETLSKRYKTITWYVRTSSTQQTVTLLGW